MTVTPTAGSPFDGSTSTQFSIAPDGTCSGARCVPAYPGPHTITGTYSTASSTGTASTTITVLTPASLVMSLPGTEPSAVTAGQTVPVTVQRLKADGTVLDDVSNRATVTLGGDPCPGAVCTATTWGKLEITATLDGMTASTEVFVNTGPAVALQVTPHTGASWDNTQAASFTVEAVDAGGNGLEDLTADSSFTIAPDGTCTGNTCTPALGGSHTVTATYKSLTGSVALDAAGPTPAAEPSVSIGSTSVPEGNFGRKPVHLTVSLSVSSSTPVTVAWHTVNGTARAGQDYVAAHGTVRIPAGRQTAQITVYVIGDRKMEPNERFGIVLTSPHGATLGTARGAVTVTNDD
jgi:hypothetical protein